MIDSGSPNARWFARLPGNVSTRGSDPNEMNALERNRSARSGPRFLRALRSGERSGQAIVEFAVVSVAFFTIVFGAIDSGRAIYRYSELSNAVREGARYGKINPAETTSIKNRVIEKSPGLTGLGYDDIKVECTGGCTPESDDVKVTASYEFTAVTQDFLGFGPITLTSSAKVEAE